VNNHPLISVVISTRNRARYLDDCLQSLAAQQCTRSFEIVVVDNASTDGTAALLTRRVEADSRFRAIREDRVGLSYGKNAGIAAARGGILVFTDDDVTLDPGWIESYRYLFASKPDVLIGGPVIPVRHDLGEWPSWLVEEALDDIGQLDYRTDRLLEPGEYVWGANMAGPARIFSEHGGWNVLLGRRGDERGTFEDTDFQDRVRDAGVPVMFSCAPAVRHRIDATTVTPRSVLATAFSRGRNAYRHELLGLRVWAGRLSLTTRRAAFIALLRYGFAWFGWSAASRVRLRRGVFGRAHRSAWGAGWALERWRDGKESTLSDRLLLRLVRLARSVVDRVAVGEPR
jgi:glycosyltransferase involved in cell wall biosynthesis